MDSALMDYPVIPGLLVFIGVYTAFFLIRVFADLYIVGIGLAAALAAYSLNGFGMYAEYRSILQEIGPLQALARSLPPESTLSATLIMSGLILLAAVFLCLPMLPFSATYRFLLGVDQVSGRDQDRIRQWIAEEVERLHEESLEESDEDEEDEINTGTVKKAVKRLEPQLFNASVKSAVPIDSAPRVPVTEGYDKTMGADALSRRFPASQSTVDEIPPSAKPF